MITIKSEMKTCNKDGIADVRVESQFIGKGRNVAAELEAIIEHLEEEHGEMFMACIASRIERMMEE